MDIQNTNNSHSISNPSQIESDSDSSDSSSTLERSIDNNKSSSVPQNVKDGMKTIAQNQIKEVPADSEMDNSLAQDKNSMKISSFSGNNSSSSLEENASDPSQTVASGLTMPPLFSQPIPPQISSVTPPSDTAQTIADLANQIVDQLSVRTNSLTGMQEVRLTFANNTLPNTEVVINLTGNQLNVTFIANSSQAAAFFSGQNMDQLQHALKSKLGDSKEVSIQVDGKKPSLKSQTLTEDAVGRKEHSDTSSTF